MTQLKNQGDLFGHIDTTLCFQSKPKTDLSRLSDLEKQKQRYNEICAYRERLTELRANIRSFSELVLTRPRSFSLTHQYVSECPAQRLSIQIRILSIALIFV